MLLKIFLTAPSCSIRPDDKVALVAELFDVLPRNADAERVESAVCRACNPDGLASGVLGLGEACGTRSCISRAALLVNVTPRMFAGEIPRAAMCAMRNVMTRVLPVPAPAR